MRSPIKGFSRSSVRRERGMRISFSRITRFPTPPFARCSGSGTNGHASCEPTVSTSVQERCHGGLGDPALDVGGFLDGRDAERSSWTFDDAVFEKWGKVGVDLAVSNMTLLVELCRRHGIAMTIAVYPWPQQILHHDLDSRQVAIWRAFAERHGLGFINYFPDFIGSRDPVETIRELFMKGDSHWNVAGHQVIARRLEAAIRGTTPTLTAR